QNPERLKAACDHSLLLVAARAAGQLVGLIRVVGDGETIIYIQDLLVQPSYQGRGIGSHLIELVLKKYPAVRQKVLLTEEAPDTRAFYEKNGFASCDHGSLVAFYREF
ncbi:N-acetyltransferase, partial [Lactobacillus sp. XV13L]|nr:N-acetyltransferase [Lactobacillus sp. XV13L]